MPDRAPRLGDVIDDYCPRCRLLLNHDVTSLFDDHAAKVTCRTCHNTHDYRYAQVPPKRKSAKKEDKKSLIEQVLASMPKPPEAPPAPPPEARPHKRDLWAEIERIKAQRKGPA
jgi:DNA-directed RNA polymerase subunit M/transcription elongation factor TFIIS